MRSDMDRDIEGTIANLCLNLRLTIKELDSESFTPRPLPIMKLKNWARESYQGIFRNQALSIIGKLKRNESVSDQEAALIEEWMVGDLELYQSKEDHFEAWKIEVQDLCNRLEVCEYSGVNSDVKCLLKIQVVIIELEHVLQDLDRYRYAIDRIRRYRSYVGQDINALAHDDKVKLADLMRGMVFSDLA